MKKLKNNKNNPNTYELYHILNPEYFHVSIQYKTNNNIAWSIFYKNLPTDLYFSSKNKPLLTSEQNSIEDIYKLKRIFEEEKNIEICKNTREYISLSKNFLKQIRNIRDEFREIILEIALFCLVLSIINITCIRSAQFGFANMILGFFIFIFGLIKLTKIEKQLEKNKKDFKEKFLKEKIRQQGLFFVERLRK